MPFFETFENLIINAVSGGLLTKFYPGWFLTTKNIEIEKTGPQVLTYEHLEIGFIACIIPLALSILVFCIEIAIKVLPALITRLVYRFAAPDLIIIVLEKTRGKQ